MTTTNLFVIVLLVAIAVFVGLAVHVISRNPRRPISWVFGLFCLTLTFGFHLSALFLLAESETISPVTLLFLRLKYAVGPFSPALFLHLVFFYFPATWQRYRRSALTLAYLFSTGLALAALFTDLVVAGPLYRPPPLIVGVIPGPLMYLFAASFGLLMIVSPVGLIKSFRASRSSAFRRQIIYMLVPTGLAVLSVILGWISILIPGARYIPTVLINLPVVVSGFFYARAVVQYGSFVDRPTAWRELFYSLLSVLVSLTIIFAALALDRRLAPYTLVPYPLATGFLVIVVTVTFPVIRPWITAGIDRLLFHTDRREQKMIRQLAGALIAGPNPDAVQSEVLHALCTILDIQGGYVATLEADRPADTLIVQVVQGDFSLRPGDSLPRPPITGRRPRLAAALLAQDPAVASWPDVALFCPLAIDNTVKGVLALGEKRNRQPFTHRELDLCEQLAQQVSLAAQMIQLRQQRDQQLETAHAYDQASS